MRSKKRNKGMAVVEITLLIPIIFGVVYLYIMLFLYLIECANTRKILVETLYVNSLQNEKDSKDGDTKKIKSKQVERTYIDKNWGEFCIRDEICKGEDSILEDIRRWQIVRNALRNGTGS